MLEDLADDLAREGGEARGQLLHQRSQREQL